MIVPGAITREQQAKINELLELVMKADAEKAGRTERAALGRFLDENPDLWREVYGMAEASLFMLAMTINNGKRGKLDICMRECEVVAEEMGYSDAPAIERLLIKQIVACWMRVQWIETRLTAQMRLDSYVVRECEHLERRLSAAQKRFTRSVESLARVRKLTRATKPLEATGPRRLEAVK